jgi:hypothetical protein
MGGEDREMKLDGLPIGITDWPNVEVSLHPGTSGTATSRARQFGDIRVHLAGDDSLFLDCHSRPRA